MFIQKLYHKDSLKHISSLEKSKLEECFQELFERAIQELFAVLRPPEN